MILKFIRFSIVLLCLYLIGNLIFSVVGIGYKTIIKTATRNPVTPGEFGFSEARFRDVQNYRDVDVVFIGSSHCYRTYDPRIFAKHEISSFNLGTTGQTPLNSYFVLKRYFDQLSPKLVIFDLNYRVINRDGLESFYDISINSSYAPEILEMAIAIKSPHAINGAISKWLLSLTGLEKQRPQQPMPGERYIPGGYVEFTNPDKKRPKNRDKQDIFAANSEKKLLITPNADQLKYIRKLVAFVKSKGTKIVLITKPEPPENLQIVANYSEIHDTFDQIARETDAPYFDFNKINLPLDSNRHFYDKEYLNSEGVKIFNPILIEFLRKKHMISGAK